MKHIALLATAGFLALTGTAHALPAPMSVREAQPAPTQCQPDTPACSVVLASSRRRF